MIDSPRIADPEDQGAVIARAAQLARIGQADLSPLSDRERWNAAPEVVQDVVIREVAARLAEQFEFTAIRLYWVGGFSERDRDAESLHRTATPYHRLGVFTHRATGIEMVLVPGHRAALVDLRGTIGGHAADAMRAGGRMLAPAIPPLMVARWPVTRGNWRDIGGLRGIEDADLPLTAIDHVSADALAVGIGLRLPNAAEWEHFARAGTTTRYYWGDAMNDEHCWHAGNSGGPAGICQCGSPASAHHSGTGHGLYIRLEPPHHHAPAEHDRAGRWNAFGLIDVIGNVWEMCSDSSKASPPRRGDPEIDVFALRGASFRSPPGDSSWSGFLSSWIDRGPMEDAGLRPVADVPGWGEVQP